MKTPLSRMKLIVVQVVAWVCRSRAQTHRDQPDEQTDDPRSAHRPAEVQDRVGDEELITRGDRGAQDDESRRVVNEAFALKDRHQQRREADTGQGVAAAHDRTVKDLDREAIRGRGVALDDAPTTTTRPSVGVISICALRGANAVPASPTVAVRCRVQRRRDHVLELRPGRAQRALPSPQALRHD
jgi:hypothetical protein